MIFILIITQKSTVVREEIIGVHRKAKCGYSASEKFDAINSTPVTSGTDLKNRKMHIMFWFIVIALDELESCCTCEIWCKSDGQSETELFLILDFNCCEIHEKTECKWNSTRSGFKRQCAQYLCITVDVQ